MNGWRYHRDRSLHHWILRRLKRGDSIQAIEASMVRALNAPPPEGWRNCRPSEFRMYDGSTWADNPECPPEPDPVILPFTSYQTAG